MGDKLRSICFDLAAYEFKIARDLLDECLKDERILVALAAVSECVIETLRDGGKIFIAGNGGSAADAQHIAGELVSRFHYDRAPLPGIALTTDTSILTAIGNDYGYEQIFARQIQALARRGDAFWGISTSGRSPNILRAFEAAREIGARTIGFTGADATQLNSRCDIVFGVPTRSTPRIQQVHLVAAHVVCGLAEAIIHPKNSSA